MTLPRRATVFVAFLAVACLACLAYAVYELPQPEPHEIAIFAVFILLSVLSEVYATWIPAYRWAISSSIAICLAALFILGPHLAVVFVFSSSLLSELFLRWNADPEQRIAGLVPIVFNVSQLVVTVSLAGLLLRFFQREALILDGAPDFALAIAAFAVYFLLNLSFVTGIVSLTEQKHFFPALWQSIRQFFVQYLVLCVSALLLAVLRAISVWHIFLALFPLTLVHISFRGFLKQQTEARKTFERISRLLDERDHYTAVHSVEVADLAVQIAGALGLSQGQIERVDIAARVHDIGKVAIPDAILLKPGPLDDEEWEIMRRHPVISAELIEGLEIYAPVAQAVRHEHERWDGSGYPDGLKGEQIPLIARVIAAADIYNALATDRPYRAAFPHDKVVEIIEDMKGADLDPMVADALLLVIAPRPEPASSETAIPSEA